MRPHYLRQIYNFLEEQGLFLFALVIRKAWESRISTFQEVMRLVLGGETFKVRATHCRSTKTSKAIANRRQHSLPEVRSCLFLLPPHALYKARATPRYADVHAIPEISR